MLGVWAAAAVQNAATNTGLSMFYCRTENRENMRTLRIAGFVAALALPLAALAAIAYNQTIEQWREQREAKLKADGGWLTLAGLFWLHEGANTVGSSPNSEIKLTRGPAKVGVIQYHGGKAVFEPAPGAAVTVNGKQGGPAPLGPGADKVEPDVVQVGDLSFFVIHRGTRDGIRVKDLQSEYRKNFTGLRYYPVREEYRVTARWVAHPKPEILTIPNILGESGPEASPGYAVFQLQGRELRLDPIVEGDELFFIFKDQTAGKETYPAGRFLHTDMPKDGKVELD